MLEAAPPDELVEQAYAVALEPERYDALMAAWESYVAGLDPANAASGDAVLAAIGPVQTHFDRAHAILQRIGGLNQAPQNLHEWVQNLPGAGLIADRHGNIVTANAALRALAPSEPMRHISSLIDDDQTVDLVLRWMRPAAQRDSQFLFLPCAIGDPPVPCCIFVTELGDLPKDYEGQELFVISRVDLKFDEHTIAAVSNIYGLTEAEAAIAALLAEGQTPSGIAQARAASINTVRTQIKSVLSKANAKGVPDLVRLICSFSANQSLAKFIARRDHPPGAKPHRRECTLSLGNGRKITYTEQGDPKGAPVLFFHNMLYGVELTDLAAESARERGWRIIAPSRPGFGGSDFNADVSGTELVDSTCRDFEQLLDHLGVEHCIVVGHSAGTIYAQRFAVTYPDRVSGLLFVSHAPHWQESFLPHLPPRQRIIARTTKLSRTSLSFLVSAGVALIESGREDQFVYALHKSIPADMRALRRPDVLAAIVAGLRHTVAQGGRAFCADCPLVLSDWSADAARLTMPLRMIHGDEDRVVQPMYFEPYVKRFGPQALKLVSGAGQYLLYSHWPQVFECLNELKPAARHKV